MAIRNIVTEGEERLRKKCREVEVFDERLHILLSDMADTMIKADGVGLAGPQVGVLKRIFIIDVGEGVVEFINPKITHMSGSQRGIEGCLSVPGSMGYVTRPNDVTVEAYDRYGKKFEVTWSELGARAICHENDHLDGKLFVDIVEERLSGDKLTAELDRLSDDD